jgi:hypothetical protein
MKLRKFENLHIVLWLMKDTCWVAEWKVGGMAMIIPTLGMALYIAYLSRAQREEFFHNLAVICWIMANVVWMCGEFFNYELRPVAFVLFLCGLGVILFYYLSQGLKKKSTETQAS